MTHPSVRLKSNTPRSELDQGPVQYPYVRYKSTQLVQSLIKYPRNILTLRTSETHLVESWFKYIRYKSNIPGGELDQVPGKHADALF